MWTLQMNMQCSGPFLEVSPGEVESAELSIETGVSHVLLAFFDEVIMEEVRVFFSPDSRKGQYRYLVHIGVACDHQYCPSPLSASEYIESTIVQHISALLKELFSMVNIEAITMQPSMNN